VLVKCRLVRCSFAHQKEASEQSSSALDQGDELSNEDWQFTRNIVLQILYVVVTPVIVMLEQLFANQYLDRCQTF
jgi:hypothetical protein